jgi:cell division protein FtsB
MIEKQSGMDSQIPFVSPNPGASSNPGVASEPGVASQPYQKLPPERLKNLFRSRARVAGSAMLILVALLLAWDVIYGQNGLSAWSAKRAHDRMLTQQIEHLRQENEALRHQNERLRDDPAAIEFQARQNLHYARPNEVIFAVPVASQPASQSSATDSSTPAPSH